MAMCVNESEREESRSARWAYDPLTRLSSTSQVVISKIHNSISMTIFSVFVISKSGGLIYSHDNHMTSPEVEKTFSYPLDLRLDCVNQRIVVTFGQRDGIRGQFAP